MRRFRGSWQSDGQGGEHFEGWEPDGHSLHYLVLGCGDRVFLEGWPQGVCLGGYERHSLACSEGDDSCSCPALPWHSQDPPTWCPEDRTAEEGLRMNSSRVVPRVQSTKSHLGNKPGAGWVPHSARGSHRAHLSPQEAISSCFDWPISVGLIIFTGNNF